MSSRTSIDNNPGRFSLCDKIICRFRKLLCCTSFVELHEEEYITDIPLEDLEINNDYVETNNDPPSSLNISTFDHTMDSSVDTTTDTMIETIKVTKRPERAPPSKLTELKKRVKPTSLKPKVTFYRPLVIKE